jgi:nucleotide-binding universal stress UspA family protein
MKTVIVPVDFSDTSVNAAHYAVKMVAGAEEVNIVLFNGFKKESDEEEAYFLLENLKKELNVTNITCHAELTDDFPETLSRLARHRAAQLIVLGLSDDKSKLERIFLSSDILKVIDKNPCPVMIIPPSADFDAVKNVALASDFKEVDVTIPVEPIRQVLQFLRPNLHIVNVNSDHYVSLTPEFLEQRRIMEEMFHDFKPEFYFIGTSDFHETINQFVEDKKIDLVITIPRSRSFIDNLFNPSHTKKLVFESTVPVLAAHQ